MSTDLRRLGKYELQECLGRGGMAEVWKALDTQLKRYVAIKLLHADLQVDPDFKTRFEREGRMMASLYHPNIVQIHDFQISPSTEPESTTAYMVMDYIEGPTLADYIRSTSGAGKFPPAASVVQLFASISSAIDYAHQRGMVHRDIKPANILLDKRFSEAPDSADQIDEPVLTDFGIAKLLGASTGAMSGSWLGTPLYISPEQVQGYPGNERSDIYSLGVILYEMCTGVLPFHDKNPSTVMLQHVKEPPPAPSLINPNIPPALSMVILRCLAKDPAARFPSASSLTAALAEAFNLPIPETLNVPAYPKDVLDEPTHYQPLSSSLSAGMTPSSPALPSSPGTGFSAGVIHHAPTPSVTPAFAHSSPSLNVINNVRTGVIHHAPTPLQLPLTPPPLPPAAPGKRRTGLFVALIALAILVLVGGGLGAFLLSFKQSAPVLAGTPNGFAFFVSSGQWNEGNNQGIEDKLQVTLHNIPSAAPGKSYYAWLLGDKSSLSIASKGNQCIQVPLPATYLFLGPLNVDHGSVAFTYGGMQNVNLLAHYSRLLITEEDANLRSASPSSDQHKWRYYAELPQKADKIGKCFSVLDYLRQLLSEGLQLQKQGIRGGLDVRLVRNVQKILEWAASARDAWRIQPDFIHRQVVRVLDYLDGSPYVRQDVPTNTPLLVDPQLAQIGLITVTQNQKSISYLVRIDNHLKNLSQAPGITSTMRTQTIQVDRQLPNVQKWLGRVRMDAQQLVKMDNNQLSQASTLLILDDMDTQANYALAGRLDPSTDATQTGTIEIHYRIQQLATFDIQPYKP